MFPFQFQYAWFSAIAPEIYEVASILSLVWAGSTLIASYITLLVSALEQNSERKKVPAFLGLLLFMSAVMLYLIGALACVLVFTILTALLVVLIWRAYKVMRT